MRKNEPRPQRIGRNCSRRPEKYAHFEPTRRVSRSLTPCSPDGSASTVPRSSRGALRRENTAPSRSASVVAGATVSRAAGAPGMAGGGVPQSTHTGSVAERT